MTSKLFYRLSIKDLSQFYCCSKSTAQLRKKELQNALNIHHIRVIDLAKYENVTEDLIIKVLFE